MKRLAIVALLAACGSPSHPAPPPVAPTPPVATPAPSPPTTPPPPAKIVFDGAPATPAGDQLAWVMHVIVRQHGQLDRAEATAHFHATFLAQAPIEQLEKVFAQLGAQLAGATLADVTGDRLHLAGKLVLPDGKLRVTLSLDASSEQITGLLFQPDLGPRPTTYAAAQQALAQIAPHAQLLVAALDHGACKPLHAVAPTEELAIGSAFKLYVLLGLADRILAGKQAWTDEIAVRDEWKSLPSGVTQNDPADTKLTVQTLAERMISLSDNTATDHLLYTVGRARVEAAVRAAKHAKPALMTPFLGTRELFLFRLGAPEDTTRYLALPEAKRRAYLDTTLAGKAPALAAAADWKTARAIGKLEWFASSEDLCRVMGALWTRAQDPKAAPLLAVLAKNPGLPIDIRAWPYVGFKGGSEPGVLDLTYLLRRADDRWFVVTASVNADEGGTVDEAAFLPIVGGVIDLLATEP